MLRLPGSLNMDLVYCFFDAANMHRWNDHLRPIDLTEIDKQAHKAAIAWVLGKYEEQENGVPLDWRKIIEYSMFSFMQRTVLTDLKPQLFHRMKKEKLKEVNDYVISEIDRIVPDMDPAFRERFVGYLRDSPECKENKIVGAAHYMATNWEFNLIYDMNRRSFDIEQTKMDLYMELSEYRDLAGVVRTLHSSSMTFIDLFGQLRFQQRWTRVPRIPQTTVLGHSLMVATMAYLHDLDTGAGDRQAYNDYYTGLFHDLPEVLTKDVISPVKVNVRGLTDMLDQYEHELVESQIFPLIPQEWRGEFGFLVFDPFVNKDDPVFGKTCGRDVKLCDIMGAYIEANVSRRYGVTSAKLKDGEDSLRKRLEKDGDAIGAVDLMKRLDEMSI